jgi:dihydropyrimidine dehydrogenase (NAD+) subunit PreA
VITQSDPQSAPQANTEVDLSINLAGIKSPNPFWLASAPPANMGSMVQRAFDCGWGGAVWKTLGDPIINVSSRLASVDYGQKRMLGLNNIELITDRPLEVNLKEIYETKKKYPNHAVIVSLMVENKREIWHEIVKKSNDTGADGIELNFGCPHGMSERGMGAATGQVPEYCAMIVEWVKEAATIPVLVKLTPNVTDINVPARAAKNAGADGLSLINTINSVMGVNIDTWAPTPMVNGKSSHGGYCGPAVKPIALHMLSSLARDPKIQLPISGIGGIENWRDAVEFLLLGATGLQVCTAVMHYGYRIIEDLVDGLSNYLRSKQLTSVSQLVGKSVNRIDDWGNLDLRYDVKARVDYDKCIGCNLCHIACEDGAHQAITLDGPLVKLANGQTKPGPKVIDRECVGCNLCSLVCPVQNCITMTRVDKETEQLSWNERKNRGSDEEPRPYAIWERHEH